MRSGSGRWNSPNFKMEIKIYLQMDLGNQSTFKMVLGNLFDVIAPIVYKCFPRPTSHTEIQTVIQKKWHLVGSTMVDLSMENMVSDCVQLSCAQILYSCRICFFVLSLNISLLMLVYDFILWKLNIVITFACISFCCLFVCFNHKQIWYFPAAFLSIKPLLV